MEILFGTPEFTLSAGKLVPSAHVPAIVTTDQGERQKWRLCLTMNDDGTWQWAPPPPDWLSVPAPVVSSLNSAIAAKVALLGIERAAVE